MMHCQNCGQNSTETSNFCRFCGTKFTVFKYSNINGYNPVNISNGNNYEYAPPQPYSWKTDEFQVNEIKPTKTAQINRVQPLADFKTQQDLNIQPFQQPQPMTYSHQCPQCRSQLYPRTTRQISTGGWIVFAVLLVTFFPLFWIGLLIKDDVRVCPICNYKYN